MTTNRPSRPFARCSAPGCESHAPVNTPDAEYGPRAADLDDALCAYHMAEYTLIANLADDLARDLAIPMEVWYDGSDDDIRSYARRALRPA